MGITANDSDLLFFNGVNGATGRYGLPPMSAEEMSQLLRGVAPPENLRELHWRHQDQVGRAHFGVSDEIHPGRLDETGWGVIFPADGDPAIAEALGPLLTWRRQQAGDRFRVFQGAEGYRPKESKTKFLSRRKVGPGPVIPEKVPYYLLLVGSPEAIPYRFQSQLGVQYAVGRIHFENVEDYAHYAQSVVRAERQGTGRRRKVSFFGVQNAMDRATAMSHRHLVKPLVERLRDEAAPWQVDALLKDDATKANLSRLLGGDDTPALLFTASHGMEFPLGDPHQLPHQGALLCGEWPGPAAWREPIPQDFYFAGDDLTSDTDLQGLIGFFFACYGAGTPDIDEFAKQAFQEQRQKIAPHPFLAALPSRMLSLPKGGALAVVGHVERAWGCSFVWKGAGRQTAVFESTLTRLLEGLPVGHAMDFFDERYAELSTVLSDTLEDIEFGAEADPYELAGMWTANNDARGYSILGDPAVRLQTGSVTTVPASVDPAIEIVTSQTSPPQVPQPPAQKPPPTASSDSDVLVSEDPSQMSPSKTVVRVDFGMDICKTLRRTPEDISSDIRLAAAIHWYLQGAVSQAQGAEIAGLSGPDFVKALSAREVNTPPEPSRESPE